MWVLGEQVVLVVGIGEEPDELAGFSLGGDEFLEGVAKEIEAEDLQFIGLDDRVNLHVHHIYQSDQVVRQLACVRRQNGLRLGWGRGRKRRPREVGRR